MADFDSFDYDIEKRLPEWWKGFGALEPVNQYTQILIADILQGLLTTMGVVQPLNCWLTIPEEYTWYHHYKATDDFLKDEHGNTIITDKAVTTLFAGNKILAQIPNTKRKCNAKIQLKLLGTELIKTEDGSIDEKSGSLIGEKENIEVLTIQNADQLITIKNVNPTSTIEILTETGEILIDGVESSDLIDGEIKKIKPTIKYSNYQESYIDEDGETQYKNINLENENKKTEIIFHSSKTVNFDLQIYLYKPTYTTEQNIRVASVSAFPIEWIRLYGYFCHPFNNNTGYKFLWEKTYTKESRTTFDRITKQYDCERFYIQVKFYGIGVPLTKGFPQETGGTDAKYQPNPNLDKWGKIYGLPRRQYKPDITEEEQPFTFPKYYPYPIEQDYWYEERMVNEYKFDDEAVNALFVRDDDFNNIGMLECIYPFMDDIWVYTETVDPESNKSHEVKDIPLCSVTQIEQSQGVDWENPELLLNKPINITLNPQSTDVLKSNNQSYKSKKIKCSFCLNQFDDEVPQDITIKGIELKFKTHIDVQSNTIKLSDESKFIIPYISPNLEEPVLEKIDIVHDETIWMKDKGYYTIGGPNNLFQEKSISREQLFKGNDGKVEFELAFINNNDFLESTLYIQDITLNIYYEIIPNDYDIQVGFNKKEINLRENTNHNIKMNIDVKNNSKIEIHDKEIFIVVPPELEIQSGYNSFKFKLDVNEEFSIDDIIIKPTSFSDGARTGWYDVLVFCEDKVIANEILIRGKGE